MNLLLTAFMLSLLASNQKHSLDKSLFIVSSIADMEDPEDWGLVLLAYIPVRLSCTALGRSVLWKTLKNRVWYHWHTYQVDCHAQHWVDH